MCNQQTLGCAFLMNFLESLVQQQATPSIRQSQVPL
jgi:hypothetical protein